jgi:EpsI family protein
MNEASRVSITPADGSPNFEANQYVIENGDQKQLMIYWYEGRGRRVASEYWGKIYTVIDSIRRRRSDGALVRVLVPSNKSEAAAAQLARDLASEAAPLLGPYVPG